MHAPSDLVLLPVPYPLRFKNDKHSMLNEGKVQNQDCEGYREMCAKT